MATHAYSVVDSYMYGFATRKMNLPLVTSAEAAEVAQDMLEQFPGNEYLNLVDFITEHAMKHGYNYGQGFYYGLDLILDASIGTPRPPDQRPAPSSTSVRIRAHTRQPHAARQHPGPCSLIRTLGQL